MSLPTEKLKVEAGADCKVVSDQPDRMREQMTQSVTAHRRNVVARLVLMFEVAQGQPDLVKERLTQIVTAHRRTELESNGPSRCRVD